MKEKKIQLVNQDESQLPFEIPVEGSLGLLALGAVGIIEWKRVRNTHKKTENLKP